MNSKVYVWKDGKWQVGIAVPLVDGEQMILVKHTADSHREALDWIEENYIVEAP